MRREDQDRPLAEVTIAEYYETVHSPASWSGLFAALAWRAAINPRLAVDLLRLAWSFRARDWYRRAPFLPLPPRDYVRWRMFTAFGDEAAIPPIDAVIRFARWRRETMGL